MGGDTNVAEALTLANGVSIHAPAWGATNVVGKQVILIGVSIHAPAWGATRKAQRFPLSGASFNPRPRMGGDTWGDGDAWDDN